MATRLDPSTPYADLLARLISGGVLSPAGAKGVYDRRGAYTEVIEAVARLITRTSLDALDLAANGTYEVHRFGPILPMPVYERTDYVDSFPQLTGMISVFNGGNREHNQIIQARAHGEPWVQHFEPGDAMMVSAACHPVYEQLPKDIPAEGITADVEGWCFRHEPSDDPLRQQTFRMKELVYVGTREGAAEFRAGWIPRVLDMLRSLELPVSTVSANDPFFGRVGTLLANGQLDKDLKTEFVVSLYGPDNEATAISSCNNAEDHFGVKFGLTNSDGEPAHTACTAFGLDRITLALFAVHGIDVTAWPPATRRQLDL